MLSFATEFPVDHGKQIDDFLLAVQSWILGSPHTRFDKHDLANIGVTANWSVSAGNEQLRTLRARAEDDEFCAALYQRNDEGLEWTTTIVYSREPTDAWVGIRVSCESSHPAARLPPAKKPIIVRRLLKDLGGAIDGSLVVSSAPHRLANHQVDVAARLINGTSGCRLPIVYVSCGFQGTHTVDADRIADQLSGMAHVVVEPDRPFSRRLQIDVDSDNVYGGTIGIYWPDGGGRRSFFIGRAYENAKELEGAIADEVRAALTNRRPLDRCAWSTVQEAASRQAFLQLRATGSNEVDKYIEEFDKEISAKDEKLADAEREISRLRAEVRRYELQTSARTGIVLRTGHEQDLYPNELLEVVLDAIKTALSHVVEESRRFHVLQSILSSNILSEYASENRDALKKVLRNYKSMNAKTQKGLENLGFQIVDEGKHYKLIYQGDERYTFPLPKTGSDYRGGLNAASDISKRLF